MGPLSNAKVMRPIAERDEHRRPEVLPHDDALLFMQYQTGSTSPTGSRAPPGEATPRVEMALYQRAKRGADWRRRLAGAGSGQRPGWSAALAGCILLRVR